MDGWQSAIIGEIQRERVRQDKLWGGPEHDDMHTPDDWLRFIRVFCRQSRRPYKVS